MLTETAIDLVLEAQNAVAEATGVEMETHAVEPAAEPATATRPQRRGPGRPRVAERAGHRGIPPPPTFDFGALSDDALLTTVEVAAVLRVSVSTVKCWRANRDHPLKWQPVGGFPRYTVGALRAFIRGKHGRSKRRRSK